MNLINLIEKMSFISFQIPSISVRTDVENRVPLKRMWDSNINNFHIIYISEGFMLLPLICLIVIIQSLVLIAEIVPNNITSISTVDINIS